MRRPRAIVVALLCGAAFLGTLAVAQAGGDGESSPSAPAPISADKPADVSKLRGGAALPDLRARRRRATPPAPAPVAAAPVVRARPRVTAPAPAAPAPAPAPSPQPAPQQNRGTPFYDAG